MTKKTFFVVPLENKKVKNERADFEEAITATGFGYYNMLLILIAIPSGFTSIFATTTISYVFPAAQCDLELSLSDKGLLNAATYLGMISSAIVWGFLFDTLGRRRLIMIGYLLDAVLVITSSFSQTKIMLMTAKFLGGCMFVLINGPFAALTSYISEFHCAKYRARMLLVLGTIYSSGTIILPLLAWIVLPQNFYLSLADGALVFHSWNLYLLICAIPSVTGTIIFIFLPESPKFLMTIGKNEKALEVFRKVYKINSGKPASTYPITALVDEIEIKNQESNKHGGHVTANRSKIQALREGWQQIKPLFFPPYLVNMVLVCSIQSLFTMNLNTLRLWLPQIFQSINDYAFFHNGTSADLCTMLEMIQPANITDGCVVNLNNSQVYIDSITVASTTVSAYFFVGFLINKLGKKKLLIFLAILCGTSCCCIYVATNRAAAVALAALYVASGSVATNVVLSVTIDIFPTTLRTMTVSISMMFARSGAMIGNVVFPLLLSLGCGPPFFLIGALLIGCAFLTILLPNTDLKSLE